MCQKDERARAAPVAAPEDDTVGVGETESDVFFRRKGKDAPSSPPKKESEAVPVSELVLVGAEPEISERLEQIEKVKAKHDTTATPNGKADTVVQTRGGDENLDIQSPVPEFEVESTTVASTGVSVEKKTIMASISTALQKLIGEVGGAMAAMLVDYKSGMALGMAGGGLDLEIAAVGNTRVVRAKMKTITDLGLKGEIEDIVITLASHYHILRILPGQEMFMCLVLDRERANLAMARYKLRNLTGLASV